MSEKPIKETEITTIKADHNAGRLDKYLTEKLKDMSRSKIQKLISNDNVLVNRKPIKANYKVQRDDEIQITIPEPKPINVTPENIPLDIIYEDEDIVIINKKQGMVVHPGAGNKDGTLVNALLYHIKNLSGINGKIRPGIVHRLDKDTSGILVVAKNDHAHVELSKQFQNRTVKRKYLALIHGNLQHEKGTIDAPIGRNPNKRQEFKVISSGKDALTHFRVLKRFNNYSLLEVSLETGRTHQIRVHLKYINHPVAGDEVYGPKKTLSGSGQYLHAHTLEFIHPRTQEIVSFEASLPPLFQKNIQLLTKETL